MSKKLGSWISHRGQGEDTNNNKKPYYYDKKNPIKMQQKTISIIYYFFQICSMLLTVGITAIGISRIFDIRPTTRSYGDMNRPHYWTITILLITVPILMVLFIVVYLDKLSVYLKWYTKTWAGRGILFIFCGMILVTEEVFDLIFCLIYVIGGVLFFIIEFLRFMPKPNRGLLN